MLLPTKEVIHLNCEVEYSMWEIDRCFFLLLTVWIMTFDRCTSNFRPYLSQNITGVLALNVLWVSFPFHAEIMSLLKRNDGLVWSSDNKAYEVRDVLLSSAGQTVTGNNGKSVAYILYKYLECDHPRALNSCLFTREEPRGCPVETHADAFLSVRYCDQMMQLREQLRCLQNSVPSC